MTPADRLALLAVMNAAEILCRAPAEHTLALAAADRIAAARHAMDGEAALDHTAPADMARQAERIAAAATAIRTELAAFAARLAHAEALAEATARLVAATPGYTPLCEITAMRASLTRLLMPGEQCADTDGLAAERDPLRAAAQDALQAGPVGWAVSECGETSTPVLVPPRGETRGVVERRATEAEL